MRESFLKILTGIFFVFFFFIRPASSQGTWTPKANFPGTARNTAVAFAIGAKGYFGTGFSGLFMPDFWEYDPASNAWTQKGNFGGGDRGFAAGFSIGNYGYIGTGRDISGSYKDFWRYDPASNAWVQMANFGGVARITASAFSVNGFGYLGTGNATGQTNDFWKYTPGTNSWTQMGNFPGGTRADIDRATFVIGNLAYWGTGANGWTDWWEYNPATDVWTQKANFPGANRYGATGFTLCGKGFLGLGNDGGGIYYNNYWQYDPAANAWSPVTSLPAAGRCDAPAFVINNKAYLGTGYSQGYLSDWWEFSMGGSTTITATASSTTICAGDPVTITASGGISYSWSTGSSSSSIVVMPSVSTAYNVTDTSNACVVPGTVNITVVGQPTVSVSGAPTICNGSSASLSASGGGTYSWSTGATTSVITVSPAVTTSYSVTVTSPCGTSTLSSSVTVVAKPTAGIICQNVCSGNTATLSASGGGNYSWSTGASASSITTLTAGTYSVIVSLGTGCADTASCSVSIFTNPVADAGPDVTIAGGADATLTASGGINYSWNTGASSASIHVAPPVTTTYTVWAADANGCTGMDTVTVFVNEELIDCSFSSPDQFLIPNAFSPNGDDENDALKLFFRNLSCIKEYEFYIYNRWGEEIFTTTQPIDEWNGTYKGSPEQSGVYTYHMRAVLLNGREVVKKGNISLLR